MTKTEAAFRLVGYILSMTILITLPTLIFGAPKQETKNEVVKHEAQKCDSVYHCTQTTL